MDEADLSEDGTCSRQEGSPYGGHSPQTKLCDGHGPSSENRVLGVSDPVRSAAGDTHEGTACEETSRDADTALTVGTMYESAVEKKCDKEQPCTTNPPVPVRGDLPKSNISNVLQHHLSKEEFLKGGGIDCETLPEISNADSSDEAIIKSVILRYVMSSWPEEQAPGLTGQLSPARDHESGAEPSRPPTTAEKSTSELEGPVATGDGSHPESSNFLTEAKSPSDKQKGHQGQTPQNQLTEKTRSGPGSQGDQVHHQFSDFSNVAPTGKTPENNIIDKPLPIDKQDHFSHELRDRLALVQEILGSLSRSNCVEEEQQERKTPDPSQETEMEPTRHIYQEHLAGTESETSLFTLTSASQKNPPASSSYIFQKISHGNKMCQRLREQTDRLRSKVIPSELVRNHRSNHVPTYDTTSLMKYRLLSLQVQEFSKSIAQDSPRHVRDKRLALEKLQGHLASLEQEFVANKEKHLTWKQQVRKHEPPAVGDFDPEREVESEMFRLEVLLEEVKEKTDGGKHTSASSPPKSSPAAPADLPPTSSPPSDEEAKHGEKRPQKDQLQEVSHCPPGAGTALRVKSQCIYVRPVSPQTERRCSHGTWLPSSPDTELSCDSASGPGLQSNRCETCGTKILNSPRGCQKEPRREFHYRYNTPGQNYSNHEGGSTFVQLHILNENKNSSPSCSKPNWIYSESTNSKPSQGEHEPTPGKNNLTAFMAYSSDLASSSPHIHSHRISGSKSSSNLSSIEETKSEGLNSSLDNALRTAIVLKETTDRMIRTITEDLAKMQRWRNQLKY